jgi:hypothetical protein
MKLKCSAHKRRVQVLPSGNVFHRDKSATSCQTEMVKIGKHYMTPRVLLEQAGTFARPGYRRDERLLVPSLPS